MLINKISAIYWCAICNSPITRSFLWSALNSLGKAYLINQKCPICNNKLQVERISGKEYKNGNI